MVSTLTDQIDKFHEDVCKLDLYADILAQDSTTVEPKSRFYSAEEYLAHHKQLLTSDLKG